MKLFKGLKKIIGIWFNYFYDACKFYGMFQKRK